MCVYVWRVTGAKPVYDGRVCVPCDRCQACIIVLLASVLCSALPACSACVGLCAWLHRSLLTPFLAPLHTAYGRVVWETQCSCMPTHSEAAPFMPTKLTISIMCVCVCVRGHVRGRVCCRWQYGHRLLRYA